MRHLFASFLFCDGFRFGSVSIPSRRNLIPPNLHGFSCCLAPLLRRQVTRPRESAGAADFGHPLGNGIFLCQSTRLPLFLRSRQVKRFCVHGTISLDCYAAATYTSLHASFWNRPLRRERPGVHDRLLPRQIDV